MKKILQKVRLDVELTILLFLFYSFIRTIFGVRVILGDNGWSGGSNLKFWFANNVLRTAYSYTGRYDVAHLNLFFYYFEIALLLIPTLIFIVIEIYNNRRFFIKNYEVLAQKNKSNKISKYEKKIEELKKKS